MAEQVPSHGISGPGSVKRPLFNKPSWSKPQALNNGINLFHRSNQTYVDLAAEAERQRKRKVARKVRERSQHVGSEERAGKRLRVSGSEDEEDDDSGSDEGSHQSEDRQVFANSKQEGPQETVRALSPPKPDYSPKSLLKRYEATVAASKVDLDQKQLPPVSHVIDLENEDDEGLVETLEDNATTRATAAKHSIPSMEEEGLISDDEFPELARQAREKARRKRLEEDMAIATPGPPSMSQNDKQSCSQTTHQPTPPPPPPDPVLDILITSDIPNTEPLIVRRKLSQRLKDVKVAWAGRQQFSQDYTDSVFLIWRGKRIFDHTTCKSLGYKLGLNGRIMASRDSMMDDEGRVHMEVVTMELFEAYKKARINNVIDKREDDDQEPSVAEQNEEAQIKIICKARGFPDFKLIVKPSTMISKICNAFRSQNGISVEQEVYMMFDGEKLLPDGKVGDTELSDMDTLDVFIK